MKKLELQVANFVELVQNIITEHYQTQYPSLIVPTVTLTEGPKYYKLISGDSVWGFISKYDGIHKGVGIKIGDLMKAAGFSTPAKHSRGNILEETGSYDIYGPNYLK